MTSPRNTGSHSVEDRRRGGLLWLWLLLAALLLGALIWALVAFLGGDDEPAPSPGGAPTTGAGTAEEAASGQPETPSAGSSQSSEPSEPSVPAESPAPAGTAAAPTAGGTLLVGDVDALAGDTDLAALLGQSARAEGVEVQELVADEAFIVGSGDGPPVLVRLAEFAGAGASESPFSVQAGDTVSFTGTIEQIDEAFLAELDAVDTGQDFQAGDPFVQVEEISGVG